MHQRGISLPGACEGLCHWRGTIEPLAANGTPEPLVAADLNLVNMFGNAEWPRIREALRTHFPEAAAWTEWNIKVFSLQELFSSPTGEPSRVTCFALSRVCWCRGKRAMHLGEFLSNPIEDKGVCDEWFVNDGQVFVRPFQFDPFPRALDSGLGHAVRTRHR